MRYCTYCGTELTEEAGFCPNCGARAERTERSEKTYESTLAESVFTESEARFHERSAGIAVLSFIFPIIGLILWAIWRDTKPSKATSAAKGALVSVCVGSPIIGLIVYLTMKDSHAELAKASAIAAIVGVIVSVVFGMLGFVGGILGVIFGSELGVEGGYYLFKALCSML